MHTGQADFISEPGRTYSPFVKIWQPRQGLTATECDQVPRLGEWIRDAFEMRMTGSEVALPIVTRAVANRSPRVAAEEIGKQVMLGQAAVSLGYRDEVGKDAFACPLSTCDRSDDRDSVQRIGVGARPKHKRYPCRKGCGIPEKAIQLGLWLSALSPSHVGRCSSSRPGSRVW